MALIAAWLIGPPSGSATESARDVYFVAVGSGEYRDVGAGEHQLPPIDAASPSARLVAETLRSAGARGGRVVLSKEGHTVTRADIESALDWLAKQGMAHKGRRPFLIFYFVGHGISEGAGWNHFSVPGDFDGHIDFSDLGSLERTTIAAADIYDSLEKSKAPFMVLLDNCYEGQETRMPSTVLGEQAAKTLNTTLEAVRVLNEFREPNPVIFAAPPGQRVHSAPDPTDSTGEARVGPLARRMVLAWQRANGKPLTVATLVSALTSASADRATSPGVTHADGTLGDLWLSGARPGSAAGISTMVGTGVADVDEPERAQQVQPESRSYPGRPDSFLEFSGPKGEYVSGGTSHRLMATKLPVKVTETGPDHVSVDFGGDESWTIELVAPHGEPLRPGKYTNAERALVGSSSKPGFSLGGGGRGCNELTASFEVKALERDSRGRLMLFDVGFSQRCDGEPAPVTGELHLTAGP